MTSQIIIITGASSGIGYEAAKMLAQSGHKVYGAAQHVCKAATSRRPKTRYAFGVGNASMRFLHTILPDRWFDALITTLFYKFG